MNILITGVSTGIGAGLAQHYRDQGHRVAGLSRRTPEWNLDRIWFAPCDVTDAAQFDATIANANKALGGLDLAILNAGVIGRICDMAEATLDEMRGTLDINLWANKTAIDALTRLPTPPKRIVAISSGASVNGHRGWNGYSLSKAALNMLIRLYAQDFPQIHFTALAPGLVDTAMQDYLCALDPQAKFTSIEMLQSKRNTPEMPDPFAAAPRLAKAIDRIPDLVESGEYVDVRKPPLTP